MTGLGEEIGLVRAVRLAGPGREYLIDDEPVDLLIIDGSIADVAPTGVLSTTGAVLDADGGWVVPGLWDNHVHTVQWALAAEREPLDDTASAAEASARMGAVAPLADGRRVGTGFRDALWQDRPTLAGLDAATGDVPTYLINADVHSVWLNSAALRREGMSTTDGVLREEGAFEISRRLNAVDPAHADRAVAQAGRLAAARGVTGIVDFDMAWNADAWPRRLSSGFASHRVEFAVYPFDLARAVAEGLRSGDVIEAVNIPVAARGLARVGPLKIISDGSLGTRTAACSHAYPGDPYNFGVVTVPREELVDLLTTATGAGLTAAVHAIGDRAATAALDAFALTGATGSIEHAQLVRHADLARFARLGIVASVQPQHALDDRDLAARLWDSQDALGYPLASLFQAGAEVRFGSDAPVAALDPWRAIAAAVTRTDDARQPWHPEERVSFEQALGASIRSVTTPGEVADLVICASDPRVASGDDLRSMPVVTTLLAGRVTHIS